MNKKESLNLNSAEKLAHIFFMTRSIEGFCSRFNNKTGLTRSQTRVVGVLSLAPKEKDIFQKDIEEALKIRASSASNLLHSLEEEGIISRVSVKRDARLKKIVLTQKGMQLHDDIISVAGDIDTQLFAGISPKEYKIFAKTCQAIIENTRKR
jgi:DNA-binding MarR family transcriptional regulator